jgi:hypothetical protein
VPLFLKRQCGRTPGFLRQQENQYVAVPDEVVDRCSPKLLKIMGYRAFGGLGMVCQMY